MSTRGGRLEVAPYAWKDGRRRYPGATVTVPSTGRFVWIDQRELARVADELIDILEELEARDGSRA